MPNFVEIAKAEIAARRALPPKYVPALNFELALIAEGLLDQVNAFVATTPQAVQTAWRRATVIERSSPLLLAVAEGIGKTQADVNALLIKARDIKTT